MQLPWHAVVYSELVTTSSSSASLIPRLSTHSNANKIEGGETGRFACDIAAQ